LNSVIAVSDFFFMKLIFVALIFIVSHDVHNIVYFYT